MKLSNISLQRTVSNKVHITMGRRAAAELGRYTELMALTGKQERAST
jgi:hypothetical protein